jgi:hypothetical protein
MPVRFANQIQVGGLRHARLVAWPMAPVMLLEIRTGGLSQKRYGSGSTQPMLTPTLAPFGVWDSIETLGRVFKTLELRC